MASSTRCPSPAIRPAVVCGSGSAAGSPAAGWLGTMLLMRLRVVACAIKMRRRHSVITGRGHTLPLGWAAMSREADRQELPAPMRRDVRLLGGLLGEVIRDSGGQRSEERRVGKECR